MRSSVLRLVALLLLLGQLVQASSAALCGRERRDHTQHCDDGTMQYYGPTIGASSHDAANGACVLIGPCSPPVLAVASVPAPTGFVLSMLELGAPPAAAQPPSFDPAPIPPPPQV